MPNVNDLKKYLKVEMVNNGDIIHFCDAGVIEEKEFKNKPGKKESILEMEVIVNENLKPILYSPNGTTRGLLAKAWGENTEDWVGKVGVVAIVEQISFGELTSILVVKPHPQNLPTRATPPARPIPSARPAPAAPTGPAPIRNPGDVVNPDDMQWPE